MSLRRGRNANVTTHRTNLDLVVTYVTGPVKQLFSNLQYMTIGSGNVITYLKEQTWRNLISGSDKKEKGGILFVCECVCFNMGQVLTLYLIRIAYSYVNPVESVWTLEGRMTFGYMLTV